MPQRDAHCDGDRGADGEGWEEELADLPLGESGFGWGLCSHCFPLQNVPKPLLASQVATLFDVAPLRESLPSTFTVVLFRSVHSVSTGHWLASPCCLSGPGTQ